jgi:transposase
VHLRQIYFLSPRVRPLDAFARKVQYSVSKPLYALRSRIECFIGHPKKQRRIATRYDKADSRFLGFVLLGCIRLWIRFVHRT